MSPPAKKARTSRSLWDDVYDGIFQTSVPVKELSEYFGGTYGDHVMKAHLGQQGHKHIGGPTTNERTQALQAIGTGNQDTSRPDFLTGHHLSGEHLYQREINEKLKASQAGVERRPGKKAKHLAKAKEYRQQLDETIETDLPIAQWHWHDLAHVRGNTVSFYRERHSPFAYEPSGPGISLPIVRVEQEGDNGDIAQP
jgi:hypothetical protein